MGGCSTFRCHYSSHRPNSGCPILRTVRPSQAVANILKWESIVIDPIGASLAVLVYEFIVAGRGEGFTTTLLTFLQLLLVGASTGLIAGYLLAIALRRHYIPEFLQNLATISVVFTSFALANHFQPESGLVTVTVFGVLLANMRGVDLRRILRFKETLSIMLISLLFIILAARLDLNSLTQLGWQALIILFIIQFIARPINVHASTIGSPLTMPERHFISWIGPRGIIAAAISSLFALKLLEYGYSDADLLISLTFMVIIGTVLIQSLTAIPVAKMLKVTLPDPDGVLIVGGDRIALLIGRVLAEQDIHVVIADSSIAQISKANAMGVETYLGNPLSEHARQHIETSAIGMVLALSPYESENVAVALHFQDELGKNNVFFMLSENGDMTAGPRALPRLRGKILFSNEINHDLFLSIMDSGGTIHHTTLSKELTMDEFMNNMGEVAIPLFTISPKGKTHCFTPEIALRPDTDWTILYLKKRKMD